MAPPVPTPLVRLYGKYNLLASSRQYFRQTHAMLTKDADSAMSVAKNETH